MDLPAPHADEPGDKTAPSTAADVVTHDLAPTLPIATKDGFKLLIKNDDGNIEHVRTYLFSGTKQDELDKQISDSLTLLVNSSEQVNNRRQTVNNFFSGINTIFTGYLLTALAGGITSPAVGWKIGLLALLAMFVCFVWFIQLRQYRLVSASKVELFEDLERKRGVRLFSSQYKLVQANGYMGLARVEAWIPGIFGLIDFCLFIYVLLNFPH